MNQILHLQTLCNKYGDFKVCIAKGEYWSKHKSVLELWEKEDWVFLEAATERQILPNEVVIDIDDEPIEEKKDNIIEFLDYYKIKYSLWKTGGKGYHFHIFHNTFLLNKQRVLFRMLILKYCRADLMKKNDGALITIEGAPHRKTGIKKRLILSTEWEKDE
jgi:hypothetical protein